MMCSDRGRRLCHREGVEFLRVRLRFRITVGRVRNDSAVTRHASLHYLSGTAGSLVTIQCPVPCQPV